MNKQFVFQLPDESRVLLRPIKSGDSALLLEGFKHLSADSRMKRFFTPRNSLSESQVRYLTDVDQTNHVAWVAVNPEETEGYGVGRFIRLAEEPNAAEYAITVIDEFHNQGLGTLLFTLIYLLAREAGLEYLKGYLIKGNVHFLERLKALNAKVSQHDGVYQVNIPVQADFSQFPQDHYSFRFLYRYKQIESLIGLSTPT